METQGQEKQRANNIIWNAAEDYSFNSGFEVYDAGGRADVYWNYIIGAVRKYYDFSLLQEFFSGLLKDPDHVFYESMTWIGLENCAYRKGIADRPVLEDLRRSYAESVLRKEQPESLYYLVDEIRAAHFQRALGREPLMREQVFNILRALEFDEALSTEEIVLRMNQIIAQHFPLQIPERKRKLLEIALPIQLRLPINGLSFPRFQFSFFNISFSSPFNVGSNDSAGEAGSTGIRRPHSKKNTLWQAFKDERGKKLRSNIQGRYGLSILPESQTAALERALCVGNHRDCNLHFTRGEFDPGAGAKADAERMKVVLKQRDKNRKYFQQNQARINNSILKLTGIIKNTLLVHLDPASQRSETGQIVAGKVWRNIYLNDKMVFIKNTRDDIGSISVDILLDASGSQSDRQEALAAQGYIIAESLKRCQIPVKVYSFCTYGNFTVINLFRDYTEEARNERIFNYHASGCNRDGLAIRTALHMMEQTGYDHKILIILSDGKPIDPNGIAARGIDPDLSFYSDTVGANDAAFEVRKGRQNGISVLCVFTGSDDDLPVAQKIYGNDLVCIKSPEKFADIVGVLIKNELKNL